MIQVKDKPHLYRDANSKGIINTDLASLHEHRNKKKVMQEIANMNTDINNIKEDINDIKDLLQMLIINKGM